MSNPPFGNCDRATTDTQLFIDNQAGLVNSTFKFGCVGGLGIDSIQNGPAFSSCGLDIPNLCIGGNKGQRACGTSTCQFIDWTKSSARACPAGILQYAQVQPKGVVTPCCDSSGCSAPSDPSNAPYTCDTSRTLYLCVNDGAAAECVEPKGNTICSGNFSGAANVPSGASAGGASQTGSNESSQPIHRVLSTPQIIGISVAGAVVLGTVILISKWIKGREDAPLTSYYPQVKEEAIRVEATTFNCNLGSLHGKMGKKITSCTAGHGDFVSRCLALV